MMMMMMMMMMMHDYDLSKPCLYLSIEAAGLSLGLSCMW
jgi:hypothetical protein